MTHRLDEAAENEGTALQRAFVSSRPHRTGCRVHVLSSAEQKKNDRLRKKEQLAIAFRAQEQGLNGSLSPAMQAYLNGANTR